jgi:tetratricopeptide (TPR) repeat protein
MNKKNFIKIIQEPNNLSEEEVSFLDEINREFPYFQTSRAIFLKSLSENEDIKFKKILRSTAAYSRDRSVLFEFVKKSQNQNEKVYFNKNEITTVQSEYKIIEEEIIEENSFVEWLKLSNLKPIDRSNETETIDKFISEKPKLKVEVNENESNNDKIDNLSDQAGYMTETLAKLYLNQKNYEKAIQSYKILILKFPEKNSYFADQIKKIKKLIK